MTDQTGSFRQVLFDGFFFVVIYNSHCSASVTIESHTVVLCVCVRE